MLADMRSIYTDTVVDHVINPRNAGSIPDSDGFARVTTPGGDTVQVWLRVQNDRIVQATFWTDGCAATLASASMVTELAKGKLVAQALKINQRDVLDALGGLPQGNVHCALLAVNALHQAIRDYLVIKNEPWKKAYRRQ